MPWSWWTFPLADLHTLSHLCILSSSPFPSLTINHKSLIINSISCRCDSGEKSYITIWAGHHIRLSLKILLLHWLIQHIYISYLSTWTPNTCLFSYLAQWWANIIKWTRTNIRIYLDARLCTKWISEYIWMQHINRTNIRIYLYSGNSTNTNNIQGSFYSNIPIFVLITEWRNF